MTTRIAMLALVCVGASGLVIAQTQTPPPDTTSPSKSSQPAPKEAPATSSSTSKPSSASSPHQRQALGTEPNKQSNSQRMKDCVAKERAANSAMSTTEAKKTCKEQFKSSSQPTNR
jgi:hypothetical protein